jgi:Ni/Fe-hydrogenase subunit HybB-like protein
MSGHPKSEPVSSVKFFTPGVLAMVGLIAVGFGFALYRFIFGIGSITNLNDQFPWGIWIGIDVSTGVALAAGGFTTSALVYIFHRERYHGLVRAALLTAMLGYTFVGIGLCADLGRYYNVWHPIIMWQGDSVLFEVGICVVCYLTVLYLEFLPIVAERFKDGVRFPGPLKAFNKPVELLLGISDKVLEKFMFILIILGVVLSCMHQSSLGALMLIAPSKMHPLWLTPISPLLFLSSAIAVGFPMVVFESMLASRSFKRPFEMDVLTPLSRMIPITLGIYLAMKIGDLAIREAFGHLFEGSVASNLFLVEMGLGVVLPFVMLLSDRVARSPKLLFLAALLVVLGVALNRINVFIVAYTPPYAEGSYFPSIGEILVTAALISLLMLVYRFVVLNFPVLEAHSPGRSAAKGGEA